ncbi:hypothetical protein [Leptolyngbya ohadii]|uniref:hypothetical protein n=1 Tax=Leptolyngbya ohadii TaxID=1962290 RepID=UPI001CEC889C|nr:hypothetical protein [Leptolyngbya ohadii]
MWLLWALSAGLIALDGFDFFIIGVALPFLQRDFSLSPTKIGAKFPDGLWMAGRVKW